jgi:hypothetical protein
MNATPRVALLPLVIIWLGIGILSKVGIIVINSLRTSRKFLSKSSRLFVGEGQRDGDMEQRNVRSSTRSKRRCPKSWVKKSLSITLSAKEPSTFFA